jgi:hypothetical protein
MSGVERKRWWRIAAVAVLGGGAVVCGLVGLTRPARPAPHETAAALVEPQPVAPQSEVETPSRPPVPAPVVPPPTPAVPPPGVIIPAVATIPQVPPVEPASLAGVTPPPPIPVVPAALPTIPASQVTPGSLPALPAVPVIPATPATVPSGGVSIPPPAPAEPVKPTLPPIAPAVPAESPKPTPKPEPAKPTVPPIAPVVPVLPPPSIVPGVPPVTELAPSPSPAKLPGSVQPDFLPKPDSGLQGGNTGNTVKTEDTGKPAGPVTLPAVPAPDLSTPAVPVPPATTPVASQPPALPAVGAPGELPGKTVERSRPAFPNSDKDVFPIPNFTAPTPGDPTVIHLNKTAAAAVLGGMLLAPASPTAAAPLPVPFPGRIDTRADGNEPKQQSEDVTKKLEAIQRDLKQLTELLNGRRDKDGYPIETSRGLVAELKDLGDRLKKVEEELTKMKGQSSSLRPNIPSGPADPNAGKGTVRVVNEYPVQISIVVNGTSYRVAPSKSQDIPVAAGEFSYQLLESGAAPTRSAIKEKELVTLRIK